MKDLFPTELVPAVLDDEEEADGDAGEDANGTLRAQKGREETGTYGRKKRAFWGRRTHPELTLRSGEIEKGCFEALVHEAAFGTTFFLNASGDEQDETISFHSPEASPEQRLEEWKTFASSILLCLPSVVGHNKFEAEFLRCCAYLVSGAGDDTREIERSRAGWLAGEYLRFHGIPADLDAWEEWRKETIPDISAGIVETDPPPVLPISSSMQAIHPSPLVQGSPNTGTFSPRPNEASATISLLGALNLPDPPSISKKGSLDLRTLESQQTLRPGGGSPRLPWAALEQEGLSRDVLLLLDPHLIAHSLVLFHRSLLDQTPENMTASFVLGSDVQGYEGNDTSSPSFSPLFGTEDQPHWLTKLLLMQILGADTSSGHAHNSPQYPQQQSPGRRSEDNRGPQQTSRTHSRSEVISVWARVGELCRLAGDECSWRAISTALCSRPVARLDKAWKRVDRLALAAIESWVYPTSANSELCVGVKEPKVTPWGGDIRVRVKDELEKASGEGGEQALRVQSFKDVRALFEDFRTAFSLCPRRVPAVEGDVGEDIRKMAAFWREMAIAGGGTGGLAAKFQRYALPLLNYLSADQLLNRVEQFMSLSLAAEPRRKGLFEPYFWNRSTSGQAPHASLLPLLFPEPLPTISLIDRTQLLRGRVDSDASDVQFLRSMDTYRRPEGRRPSADNPELHGGLTALSQGGTVIPVYNGDLLLVVQAGNGLDSTPSSRPPSSRAPSRPPSSIVDSTAEKGLGRTPSIRVKPGASQGLDRKSSVARRNSLPSLSHRQNFVMSEPSSEPPLRVIVQAGTLNTLVDILVHGLQNVSVSVADDNGEMSLRESMTRELIVDRVEFAKVWWNVFRSFVSPLVFFEVCNYKFRGM